MDLTGWILPQARRRDQARWPYAHRPGVSQNLPRPEADRASADRLALGWFGQPNPLDRIGRGCPDAHSPRLPGAQIRGGPRCRMTMVNGEV
jgi:hypothetical protein